MPRYRRPPLTLAAIQQDGPPLRVRDLVAITGLTPATVRAEVASGHLVAHRLAGVGYWMVQRAEARRWLEALGFSVTQSEMRL
ncbi:MAG TPA: hypothetical protein VG538_06075 [Vicinamibacterales bacterium]|jgi:hypothetical protein|nr:hypothetical protein [Vicinamibacterales bacterium]